MRIEHVIHLAGGRVSLYSWNRDRFAGVGQWDLAPGRLTPLLDSLQVGAAGPIGIIADQVEEEHIRDKVARLRPRDQKALLARRLARAFTRTPYRTALLQGRDHDDPPGQRVLFCALTNPDALNPLLAELRQARLPVAVVTSPALLCGPILQKLRPGVVAGAATMLVSRQGDGSLRLTFFRGTELAGSRLLRNSVAAPPGDLERLLRQLEESVRYFEPAFAPSAANPVEVLLLAEPELDLLQPEFPPAGSEAWHLRTPSMASLTAALSVRATVASGRAEHLYVELLRRHSPAGNFAEAADLRYFQLHRVRSLAKAACVTLAGTGLLAAGLNTMGIVEARSALTDTRKARDTVNAALQSHDQAEGDADPLEMQRTVAAWEALRRHRIDPRELLTAVSRAVSEQPRIQVDSIQWTPMVRVVNTPEGDEAGNDQPQVPEAGSGEAADESMTEAVQRVRISVMGRIEPFDHNYSLAFTELQRFMDRLRADPRVVNVVARKQPLDVNPRSTLSGEMSRERREEEAAFAVDIVMRMQDESA